MAARDSILVTGGAGFVGSHFTRAAIAAGSRVVVLDDLSAGTRPELGCQLVVGDIADGTLVARLLRDHRITAVVHFAGKIQVGESVRDPRAYFDGNLVKSLVLLATVLDHGCAFVFSSTAAVYGTPAEVPITERALPAPINPYGVSKLAVEQALAAYGHAYGLRWAALRYFNAAGAHPDGTLRERHDPETHLIPLAIDAALGHRPPLVVFGRDYPTRDGTCVRDYVHVCDLADAHLAALDALDRGVAVAATNLGSAHGATVLEVLREVERVLGVAVPHGFGARRDGDPPALLASNARAHELLGWSPKRSDLATVIADAAASRRGR
jgi:UDP-glucose-4-epimerase GalE